MLTIIAAVVAAIAVLFLFVSAPRTGGAGAPWFSIAGVVFVALVLVRALRAQ